MCASSCFNGTTIFCCHAVKHQAQILAPSLLLEEKSPDEPGLIHVYIYLYIFRIRRGDYEQQICGLNDLVLFISHQLLMKRFKYEE